jgi:galactokinase
MIKRHQKDLPELIGRRCQFIVEENQRVLDLGVVLPEGQIEQLSALFATSYSGARDLYEIGAPAMAAMMHAMLSAPGVVAARQAGAGFGGSMVALVKSGFMESFTQHVIETYHQETKLEPEVYSVKATPGAQILDWV